MKQLIFALIILLPATTAFSQKKHAQSDLQVVIVRHGEKPDQGDNLSCRGFNRATQLPVVLVKQFGVPNYAYVPAPSTGKATKNVRMMQTIWPLAIKYNLTLNSKFEVAQTADLGKDILKRSGTVVVVWEHDNIPDIVNALGINEKLKWPGKDFDSIWIVSVKDGIAILTKAQEGITAKDDCAF